MSRDVRAGKAFVELYVKNRKLIRGLSMARRRLRNFGSAASAMGRQVAITGVALLAPFIVGTTVLAGFSDAMLTVKAVSSGTAGEFAKLSDVAKELGRTTSFTAVQVAEGMISLGRAKFDRRQIIEATDDILALARATGTELADAAMIAGGAMNGFNLAADQMARITDVQTFTVNNSAQTLEDYGEALKMVASIASEAGDGIEDVSSLIAILANNTIKGTMAGTAIARAYKNLASDKTSKTLADLGVDAADADRNMRPLADIIRDIGDATADLGSRDRLAAFETLFGRGSAAALKLAAPTADLRNFREELDNVKGTAKATAEEMDSGIGGSFRRLMSAVEGSLIAIGETIEAPLKVASEFAGVIAGLFTEIAEKNPAVIASFAAIAVGVVAVGVGLMGLGVTATLMSLGLGAIIGVLSAAATVMTAALSPVLLLAAGFTAIAAGLLFLARNTELVQGVGEAITGYAAGISDMVKTVAGDATTAWDAIKIAIAAGDTEAAMAVVTATLKLQWARLMDFWMEKTEGFRTWWTDATFGIAIIFTDAVAGVKTVWVELLGFMRKAWDDWKNNTFTEGLASLLAPALALVTPGVSTEQLRETLTEDFATSRAGSEGRKFDIDAETQAAKDRIEADRKAAESDLLEQSRNRSDGVAAARAALEAAKLAVREAVGGAHLAAAAGDKPGDKKPGAKPDGLDGGSPLAAAKGAAFSTFSSAAALAMSGGSGSGPQERTAKAAETTVKKLDELINVSENLLLEAANGVMFA